MKKFLGIDFNNCAKDRPKSGYFFLIALYLIFSRITSRLAVSSAVFDLKTFQLPVSSFAGAFASIANVCIISLVVFYGTIGFFTGIAIFIFRFTVLLTDVFVIHSIPSIPGIFTNLITLLAVILIYRRNTQIEKLQKSEINHLKEQQQFSQRLFEQTASALVNAIDAKDEYSRGHSQRVAQYSEKIARYMGKSEEDCRKTYYAALLHDVGKIGISDSIINKDGEPTEEEYKIIMQHPIIGEQILSGITEYPYISIGAKYHHERYDGKGYPEGRKGDDIPEVARIIAVADTYDAMTSSRSYRDALPQLVAREEIVKGAGTQFDPSIVKIMQHLIDLDLEYALQQKRAISELAGRASLVCKELKDEVSDGIRITYFPTTLRMKVHVDKELSEEARGPELLIFDSFDGRYHDEESLVKELRYFEFCEIWFDGTVSGDGIRKYQTEVTDNDGAPATRLIDKDDDKFYEIVAMKYRDHALITINDGQKTSRIILALPDSSRFVYLSVTGEYCTISDFEIEKSEEQIAEDYIPRIAPKITFIDVPAGDIPNVEMYTYRTDATSGIPITDGMELRFHTMSLPTASLIWHCAYMVLFYSKDGEINGEGYEEYALIRIDGEYWETDGRAENKLVVNLNDDFEGWESWKQTNKKGIDCTVSFKQKDNEIIVTTQNLGVFIKNTTVIAKMPEKVYVALTGDQCAITNIRINRNK